MSKTRWVFFVWLPYVPILVLKKKKKKLKKIWVFKSVFHCPSDIKIIVIIDNFHFIKIQVQYYFQLAQQHQAALQQPQVATQQLQTQVRSYNYMLNNVLLLTYTFNFYRRLLHLLKSFKLLELQLRTSNKPPFKSYNK